MKLFKFMTRQPIFDKERHGIKNNTVREIDLNDERFVELIKWMRIGWNDGDILIQIDCVNSSPNFIRKITDITVYNNIMIITWEPKGGKT